MGSKRGQRRRRLTVTVWPRKKSSLHILKGLLAAGSMLAGCVRHCWRTLSDWLGHASYALFHQGAQKRLFGITCLSMAFCALWVTSPFENCCVHVGNNVINHNAQYLTHRLLIKLTYSFYGFLLQKLPQTMNFIKMQMSDLHLLMQLS